MYNYVIEYCLTQAVLKANLLKPILENLTFFFLQIFFAAYIKTYKKTLVISASIFFIRSISCMQECASVKHYLHVSVEFQSLLISIG